MAMARTVTTLGQNRVKPCEYFSPSAQMISRSPASTNESHAIVDHIALDRGY